MARVFIGIGSNEGDRLRHISDAVRALAAVDGIRVVQMATIAQTEPVGGPPQGPYLNTVVEIETILTPQAVLQTLQQIERRQGRLPSKERWGPRPIDLDLLLYDQLVIEQQGLSIPHPRLHQRRFVLEPLVQLAPEVIHPVFKQPLRALLAALDTPPASHASPSTTTASA